MFFPLKAVGKLDYKWNEQKFPPQFHLFSFNLKICLRRKNLLWDPVCTAFPATPYILATPGPQSNPTSTKEGTAGTLPPVWTIPSY